MERVGAGTRQRAAYHLRPVQDLELGAGTQVAAAAGWGSTDGTGSRIFYTPHLRHVSIDSKVPEAPGKKYVYGWADRQEVKPIAARATWDETNTCWIFDLGRDGTLLEAKGEVAATERERDAAMRGGL